MRKGEIIDTIRPGTEIAGYKIGGRIKTNKNSFLYMATRINPRRGGPADKVIFKVIRDCVQRELIMQEIEAHEVFSGAQYIAFGFDFVRVDDTVGYFMELFSGGDLFDFVYAYAPGIPEVSVREMSSRVLFALNHMHELGWVHRDVKLENVFLSGLDDCPDTFLGDLGFAACLPASGFFSQALGTETYAAPELLQRREYGPPVDMWAFGVMIYAMFTHAMPFGEYDKDKARYVFNAYNGNWNRALMTRVGCSDDAIDLVDKLLKVNPEERLTAKGALEHRFFSCSGGLMKVKDHLTEMSEAMNAGINFDP